MPRAVPRMQQKLQLNWQRKMEEQTKMKMRSKARSTLGRRSHHRRLTLTLTGGRRQWRTQGGAVQVESAWFQPLKLKCDFMV
jgi:hypothetical protein